MGVESLMKYGSTRAPQMLSSNFKISKTQPVDYTARALNSIDNATQRVNSVGAELPKPKKGIIGTIFDTLQRPGYALNSLIGELIDKGSSGSTPDSFDPFRAFGRGLTLQDRTTGKDLAISAGVPQKEMFNLFGWKPTVAGTVGLAWDMFNPADPLNWVAPALGKAITKGGKGVEVLAKAYGDDVAEQIVKGLYTTTKGTDIVTDTAKLERVAARDIGELTSLVMKHAGKAAKSSKSPMTLKGVKELRGLLEEGMLKAGNTATTKLPYNLEMPLAVRLTNPFTNKAIGEAMNIPGTAKVGGSILEGSRKLMNNPIINDVLRAFKSNMAPSSMSNSKLLGKISTKSVDDILEDITGSISKVGDNVKLNVPVDFEELTTLKNALKEFDVNDIDSTLTKVGFTPRELDVAKEAIDKVNAMTNYEAPFTSSVDKLQDLIKQVAIDEGGLGTISPQNTFKLANVWKKASEDLLKDFDATKSFTELRGLENVPPEIAHTLRETLDNLPNASKTTVDTLEDLTQDYAQRVTDEINSLPDNLKEQAGQEIYSNIHKEYLDRLHRITANIDKWDRKVGDIFNGIDEVDRKAISEVAARVTNKNPLAEADNLGSELWDSIKNNDKAKKALLDFVDWRKQIIEDYSSRGISTSVLEKYVPLIPKRNLKPSESSLVSSLFRDSVVPSGNNLGINRELSDLLETLDPNLIKRTTNINSPNRINKLLDKDWLEDDAAIMMSLRGSRAIRAQETYDFMKSIIDKYGFTMEQAKSSQLLHRAKDYTLYTVDITPSGKQVFKQATADMVDNGMEKAMLLPTEIANTFNNFASVMFEDEPRGAFLRLFDNATSEFRKMAYLRNPGHIKNDFTGNIFNLWLGGLNSPKPFMRAAQILKDPESVKIAINGAEYTGKQILDEASERGILEVGAALAETTEGVRQMGKNGLIKKYDNLMRDMTKSTDTFTRLSGYVDQLMKGKDFDESAIHVKKFLFDYFDLTPFERKYMRRIVPFYTWTRKNLPLQIEQLIKQPGKYRDIAWLSNDIQGGKETWEDKPEYIRDMGAVRIPKDGDDLYLNPNLPYTDLSRLPLEQKGFNNLLGSLNPFLRVPLIEWPTNTKLFSGREISNFPTESQQIPLSGLLNMLGVDDKYIPDINKKYAGYALEQIPFLRNLDLVTDPDNPRQIAKVSSFIGGPSYFTEESVKSSKAQEDLQALMDLMSEIKENGKDIPTMNELKKSNTRVSGPEMLRQRWSDRR